MSQNSITLTQDTVIKMTIKQGVEEDRISSTYGKFDTGELAFTRDTKRIFVGDCNMNDSSNLETIGGSISGNKYLGIVDSKRSLDAENNGLPIDYETTTSYENGAASEKPVLTSDSLFRVSDNKRWSTKAHYNEVTDAYDGDYLYDVYTNSIVFFDHRITLKSDKQPTGLDDGGVEIEEGVDGKRKTKLTNYFVQNSGLEHPELKTQGVKTYGEGYVVFRNIIPDNKTIRFVNKDFDKTSGEPTNIEKGTYSHNVLEVFNIPAEKMTGSFDTNIFTTDSPISLKNTIPVDGLTVRTTGNTLSLPNSISFTNNNDSATYTFATSDGKDSGSGYKLQVVKSGEKKYTISVVRALSDDTESVIYLGEGLEAVYSANEKSSILKIGDPSALLSIKSSTNDFDAGYYKDPFYTETEDSTIYISNAGYDNGLLSVVDDYSTSYKNNASSYITKFQNANSSFNLFKEPFFLAWTGVSGAYASACSVNLQGTIYKFPHISKKSVYAGSTTLTDTQKSNTLNVVGWNTSSPSTTSVLAIDNYPNQGDVWVPDSSYEGRKMYSYPLSGKTDTSLFTSVFESPVEFSSFYEMLSLVDGLPKISEAVFTIAKETENGEEFFSLVTEMPQIDTTDSENTITEDNIYNSFSYSSVVKKIEKIYLDDTLVFTASTKTLDNTGNFFHKVGSGSNLVGFLATKNSNLFRTTNSTSSSSKPVKRTLTIEYNSSGVTKKHTIDINPSEYWEEFTFYENVNGSTSTFYLEMPEIDSNGNLIINETIEQYIIESASNKIKMYEYNTSYSLITGTTLSLTKDTDYTREAINSNWYKCTLKSSVYSSLNVSALGVNVTQRTYDFEDGNYTPFDSTYRIFLQTPLVRFANVVSQPSESGLNATAKNYRIPHTATSILIEMTNDSSNPIYIITSNNFENLKKFEDALPATTTGVFWSVSSASSLPSLVTTDYWNSLNSYEKALKNLPANSREIVEVPLVNTLSGTKDFFLRISNITGATSASFAMRVVGYRS